MDNGHRNSSKYVYILSFCLLRYFFVIMTTIRKGKKSDVPAVFKLVQELALYEKAPEEVLTSVAQYEEDGFGEKPLFEFFVAEDEKDGIVGIAFFYVGYSTWKGKMVYLDDLVITQTWRRKGIGSLLMDRLIQHSKEIGAQQLRWHVLDWNTPAIRMYEKMNAELDGEWVTCKLDRAQIENWKQTNTS